MCRGRIVKTVPPNNFGVNNANKQYKCALKCLLVLINVYIWLFVRKGFCGQTCNCKKGTNWLKRLMEAQHYIQKVSEYDQEIAQSHTAVQPTAP